MDWNTQYELNKGLALMLKGGVIMDVTANDIEEDTDNTPTDDEGNNQNEQTADKKEETPYKEGWQVKVRELSAFESMTNQVRQAIGRIYRRDKAYNGRKPCVLSDC